jgi:hypothetical protein
MGTQSMQVTHFQMRLPVFVMPNMRHSINPHHLHARVHATDAVKVCIITNVQNFMRQHPGRLRTRMKDAHVGLSDAQ